MKVFISWSGPRSEKVGAAIKNWLPNVLQSVQPYFTPSDIEKGARGFEEITKELSESKIGLLCLTRDNINSNWILFEAGALSKTLGKSRVCPILLGIKPTDLSAPLNHFQATEIEREDFRKLINVINNCLEEKKLSEKTIRTVFDKWWPDLEKELNNISEEISQPDQPIRTDREILEEMLQWIRKQERRGRVYKIPSIVITRLLERYINLHDQEMNNVNSSQDTLDSLKEIHAPIESIISRLGRITSENNELFDKFQNLSYETISEEIDNGDVPF